MTSSDDEAVRRLDERLREARGRLDRLAARVERGVDVVEMPADCRPGPVTAGGHVLFVPSPAGYDLVVRDGMPPAPGETVEPGEGGATYLVTKVARSPLPGDRRPCAYLQLT